MPLKKKIQSMGKSEEETLLRLERKLDKILQKNESHPLFIKEDCTPMDFCMDIAKDKKIANLLLKFKKLVKTFGGSLKFNLGAGGLFIIKFVHFECLSSTSNDYFLSSYLIDCVNQKKILDLNLYRASQRSYDDQINVMNIMKGINSWEEAVKNAKSVEVSDFSDENEEPVYKRRTHLIRVARPKYVEKESEVSDFSGEEEELLYHQPKYKMKVSRRNYTFAEEKAILNYIIRSKLFFKVKGNEIWKRMEAKKVCPSRTWQSMKERYMKYIIPKLRQFKLDSHVEAKLEMPFQSIKIEAKEFCSKQGKTSKKSNLIDAQLAKDVCCTVTSSGEDGGSDLGEHSLCCPIPDKTATQNKYGTKTTHTNEKSSPLKKSASSPLILLDQQEENSSSGKANPNSLSTSKTQLEAISPIKHRANENNIPLSDISEEQNQAFLSKTEGNGKMNQVPSSSATSNDTLSSNDTIIYEHCTDRKYIPVVNLDPSEFSPGSDNLSTSSDDHPVITRKKRRKINQENSNAVQMEEVKCTKPKDEHPPRLPPNAFFSETDEEKWGNKNHLKKECQNSFDDNSDSSDSCIVLLSKIKNYTEKDDITILKYVYINDALKWVKGRAIWQEMQDKDIIPGRSWHSLKERFIKRILPRIESYDNLSPAVIKKFSTYIQHVKAPYSDGSKSHLHGKYYTMEEDLELLNFITQNKRFREIKGRAMWVSMAKALSSSRSWESLKNRFLRNIYPNLKQYKISEESKNEFRNCLRGEKEIKLEEPIALKKEESSSLESAEETSSSQHNQTNEKKSMKNLPKERARCNSSEVLVQIPLQISPNDLNENSTLPTSSSDEITKIDRNRPNRHKLYPVDNSTLYNKTPDVYVEKNKTKENLSHDISKIGRKSVSNHDESESVKSRRPFPSDRDLDDTPFGKNIKMTKEKNLVQEELASSQKIENTQTTKIFSDYEGDGETSDYNESDSPTPASEYITLPRLSVAPQDANRKDPGEFLASGTSFRKTFRRLSIKVSPKLTSRTSPTPRTMLNTKRKRRKTHRH